MRNIALSNARSKYVLLTDVDFLPSPGLHETLSAAILNKTMTFDDSVSIIF